MRVVFVGGGTGGHFYPLIAIAEALRQRENQGLNPIEMYYLGPDPYNKADLERLSIKHVYCPAGKQRLYFSWRNYTDKFKIIIGSMVAFVKLFIIYPDVIMSKGGYTSVPVVLAAWLLHIPIVIHESDAIPGRANQFAKRFARYIGIAHDDAATSFLPGKVSLVGMPIRESFFIKSPNPYQELGIPKDRPVILVTGGSSGAERINNLVLDSLNEILPDFAVIHQVGEANLEKTTAQSTALITDQTMLERYYVLGNLTQAQFAAALDVASLVVSRAGSGTIFELAIKGKPAIIIPIPEDISRDQRKNAYSYAHTGAASVIEEENITDNMLATEIHRILDTPGVAEDMTKAALSFTNKDGAYKLADTLIAIGKEHE